MKNNKNKQKKSHFICYLIILFALAILFSIFETSNSKKNGETNTCQNSSNIINFPDFDVNQFPMSIHFLNVGHADSTLIQCEGKNILIDSGWQDPDSHVILYCKSHNVEKFDLVIATHPHADHIGEMPKIIENFSIDTFIIAKFQEGYQEKAHSTYEKMLNEIKKHKSISLKKVACGDSYKLGNLKIDVLAPAKKHNKINNNSVVVRLNFGNRSFLFTGDAEKESENEMIENGFNLESDILKVAHHGSSTSSQIKFLEAVSPKFSIISFGKTTYASEPNKKTVANLTKVGSKILRTDKFGDIVFLTDGKIIKLLNKSYKSEKLPKAA